MLSRVFIAIGAAYVGAALMGHALERRTSLSCDCLPSCWCRKPGVGLFRWVVPRWHRC